MLLSFCLFLLIVPHHTYDSLPHTALQKVPAKLGEDVQLRCTKIIEQNGDDYIRTAFCHPGDNKNCSHAWSKDGKVLDDSDVKYETKSIITYDYCENFEWSTDLIKEFGSIVDFNSGNKRSVYSTKSEMSCFASVLTIKNVTGADLGEYKCNFSDHNNWNTNRYAGKITVLNITLYDINDTAIEQPKAVEYFENYYTKGLKEKILVQCVTTGGELQWYVDLNNCSGRKKCSPIPLQEIDSQDFWRCFNFSENQHTRYPNITESFVYFAKVCGWDDVRLSCRVGDITSKKYPSGFSISRKTDYYDRWRYYDREMYIAIACTTVIPLVTASLIVFGIIAMVRAKICVCCRSNSTTPVLHYQPQYQQQPPSYHS